MGFKIGDIVMRMDGDKRPHKIVDITVHYPLNSMKHTFFQYHYEDGGSNISESRYVVPYERNRTMIENIPDSLKDKLKNVDLSKLEQCILDAKEMAKEDLTGNTMLRERIPLLIKMIRQVKTEVARTSIECRPDRFDVDRAEWYEPFEDIQKALDFAEYQVRTKLREHE